MGRAPRRLSSRLSGYKLERNGVAVLATLVRASVIAAPGLRCRAEVKRDCLQAQWFKGNAAFWRNEPEAKYWRPNAPMTFATGMPSPDLAPWKRCVLPVRM